MESYLKIPPVGLQLLLILSLMLGTQATVKADQLEESKDAYNAGNYQKAFDLAKPLAGPQVKRKALFS